MSPKVDALRAAEAALKAAEAKLATEEAVAVEEAGSVYLGHVGEPAVEGKDF